MTEELISYNAQDLAELDAMMHELYQALGFKRYETNCYKLVF